MDHVKIPLLPTKMVGSYPRPAWYQHELEGRDIYEAFKQWRHIEAYTDATRSVVDDQLDAGLDVLGDGQMYYDEYTNCIGAFFWYNFERIGGLRPEKYPHPARAKGGAADQFVMDEAGAVSVYGPVTGSRLRLATLYALAQGLSPKPIKASVGAGAVQLSTVAIFEDGPVKNRYDLSAALADVYHQEMENLVTAGCQHIQYDDLGAWIPNLTGERDFKWVTETVSHIVSGIDARVSWHFCFGNAWGNRLTGMTKGGYGSVLPHYWDVPVDEFVLDFACREMEDVDVLADLPADKSVAAGVINVRSLEVEAPEQVAQRIRAVLAVVPPERVTLTTDCGMKQLPRVVAKSKLKAMVAGADIVRRELTGS